MIKLTQKQKIITQHLSGVSNRAIAANLHVSKNTVNKYVREYDQAKNTLMSADPSHDQEELISLIVEKPRYNVANRKKRKATYAVWQLVSECVEENERKISSGRRKQIMKNADIWEYVCRKGYSVSYSTVTAITRELNARSKEAYIRQTYKLGECCEFDWGEVQLRIGGSKKYKTYQMAVFTPPFSNYRYGILFEHQDTAAFLSSHVNFIKFSGGVFPEMVYDNMRVAVRKFVGLNEKEPTEALLQLSTFYGFRFRFCNIYSGNEKGSVERSVEYVRRKAFSEPGKDCFESLDAANEYLSQRLIELSEEKSNGESIKNLFEREKQVLLPYTSDYPCFTKRTATIDKYSTFSFECNHYSAPEHLVGQKVELRIYAEKVVAIYNGKIVATHSRCFDNGKWFIDIFHYLKTLKKSRVP